jgi:hypothetical protein
MSCSNRTRQPLLSSHRLLAAVGAVFLLLLPWVARSEPAPPKAVQALATLERGWVENAGQWDERAAFSAPGYFGTTCVTKHGELRHVASKENCKKPSPEAGEPEPAARRFRKPCPTQTWALTERWVEGKVKGIRGEEELETKVSYFLGNDPAKHRSGLPSYRFVSLGEVWPGVEVKLKASQKTVEKLFYLRPGTELANVRVELRGAEWVQLPVRWSRAGVSGGRGDGEGERRSWGAGFFRKGERGIPVGRRWWACRPG